MRRLLRRPAPTIRLRLTITYGVVFLITGAVLLTIGYALVRHNVGEAHLKDRLKLGRFPQLVVFPGPAPAARAYFRDIHRQLIASALHQLLVEYILALAGMTAVSVGAGWVLAGRALRPLREITATAQRVSSRNLGERIALEGPADELKGLADTIDKMLARLDRAFAGQRHFVANASHELRTPLAIMRTEIDVALADPEAEASELRAMGEALRETIDRCERLIEGLLVLAQSEGATREDELIDVRAVAGDCLTDLRSSAQAAGVEVRLELGEALTRGDARLVERLVTNLIDNGIRHNVDGGWLLVRTETDADDVVLTIANGGQVIPAAELERLAEPFRRLDRGAQGFGLGLSIARSVAEAHGGELSLVAPATGGLEAVLRLKRAPPPPAPAPAPAMARPLRGARAQSGA